MRSTIITILATVVAVLALAGCDPSGDDVEAGQQSGITGQLVQNQPIPNIGHSQMRTNLIDIETAEATGVQTTSFIFNRASPDPIEVCSSIGVPIPNTSSLSNPQQVANGYNGSAAIAQMDPNGVYTPTESSGTFVQCVTPDGSVEPVYAEGEVTTVFGAATWDSGKHQVVMAGPPSAHFTAPRH